MTKISIVICTYNRVKFLELALNSLVNQSLAPYEVIIVDNKSTDSTADLVKSYNSSFPRLIYCFEEKIGLSHARNRGINEATSEYIAYIDDDCVLPNDWYKVAIDQIENFNLKIFGGPVFPFYLEKKPTWFKDEYQLFSFGDKQRFLGESETLFGGNIIIHRDVFKEIGKFDVKLGMSGAKILYSEETEFQRRYRQNTLIPLISYIPHLIVKHYVRPEKLTLKWNIRAFIGKGMSNYRAAESQSNNNQIIALTQLFIQFLKLVYFFSLGGVLRSRENYPYYQNYIMERVQPHLKKYGFLLEQFKSE